MTSFAPGTDPKVIKSVNDRWLANQQEGPRSRTKVFKPTRNQQHNRMKINQRNIRGQQDGNFGIYTRPPSPLPGSGGTTVTEMGEMTYDGPVTYSGLVGGKLKSLTKKQFDRMNSKTRPKPKTPRAPSHGDPPPKRPRAPSHGDPPPKIGKTRGDLYAPGYMGGPTDAPIPIPGYGPKHPMWKGPRNKPIRGKPRPIRGKPIRDDRRHVAQVIKARKLLALRNNQIKKKLALRNKQIKKKLVARNQLIKKKLEERNRLLALKRKRISKGRRPRLYHTNGVKNR